MAMTELERKIMAMSPEDRKKAVEHISSQMDYMGPMPEKNRKRKNTERLGIKISRERGNLIMLGAIIGDIVGSPFEFDRNRDVAHSKKYPLISRSSKYTDDTVMTLAVADALMHAMPKKGQELTEEKFENCLIDSMHWFGDCYPNAGYGAKFYKWLFDETVTGSYNRINASKFMEYCYN